MVISLKKPENFKEVSRIADRHSINGPLGDSNYHRDGAILHDAAAKLGKVLGMSWDQALLIQHHVNLASFHQKMHDFHQKMHEGLGKPTEGPHAPGKGSLLGRPIINTTR